MLPLACLQLSFELEMRLTAVFCLIGLCATLTGVNRLSSTANLLAYRPNRVMTIAQSDGCDHRQMLSNKTFTIYIPARLVGILCEMETADITDKKQRLPNPYPLINGHDHHANVLRDLNTCKDVGRKRFIHFHYFSCFRSIFLNIRDLRL